MTEHRSLARLLEQMIRREPPVSEVVAGSTPVVAFGDFTRARVATLGINPSAREFVENGQLLGSSQRRLATLASLASARLIDLTPAQVQMVFEDCNRYFKSDRNPYRRWFDPLDRVLRTGTQTNYYEGTACHLDLIQWATDPVWGKLSEPTRALLLEDGVPHLRAQLDASPIQIILMNGRQVLEQVEATGLASLKAVANLNVGSVRCTLYAGAGSGINYFGWSTNLQSSFGVTREFAEQLALAVAHYRASLDRPQWKDNALVSHGVTFDQHGHIPRGTKVQGKSQLHALLSTWLAQSDADRLGDTTTFGGSACVTIELGADRIAVLNADTKRDAVEQYVTDADRRGSEETWAVIPNRNGKVNKVTFRADRQEVSGWFCYLRTPLSSPADL